MNESLTDMILPNEMSLNASISSKEKTVLKMKNWKLLIRIKFLNLFLYGSK